MQKALSFTKIVITLETPARTAQLGGCLFGLCQPGDIFALYGTLGTGKSVLARGFVQAACGENEDVPSPTFTLVQYYDAKNTMALYHFDLYRLEQPDEAVALGLEDAFYDGVSLIEWPEKLGGYLPPAHFSITLDYDRAQAGHEGEATRVATIVAPVGDNRETLAALAAKLDRLDIKWRKE